MDPTDAAVKSRVRVQAARRRLESRFGAVPVVDQSWPLPSAAYDDYVARVERGTLGGAGAWVVRDDGRVLLVRETDRDAWSEPSGGHEPGETLRETARREVREETGIRVELTGVELFQHLHVRDKDGDRPVLHRAIVVFGAEPTGGSLDPPPDEIDDARWFAEHPEPLLYEELRDLGIPASE